MKKILTVFLLAIMVSNVFIPAAYTQLCLAAGSASAVTFTDKIKAAQLPKAVNVKNQSLEELLAYIQRHSGITLAAAPEVADMKVDLQIEAGQTIEQILTILSQNYNLSYVVNEKTQAVIVLKGSQNDYRTLYAPQAKAELSGRIAMASIAPGGCYVPPANYNTEEYKRIYDNSYQSVNDRPLSTFSIDVDTASYSNLRRYINSGQLPPADAVRTEELVNYFSYDYLEPTGSHPFSVTAEIGDCPWQPSHKLVMVGLQGKRLNPEEMPPANLVFLIDVSGSMSAPNKLPLLKTAFKMLVKELRDEDKVSIVVYAGQAGVVLEPTAGSEKAKITAAIDSLQAGGSTAGGEGLKLAYKIARNNFIRQGNNRVILATDGDFNVGVSSEGDLTRLIEERRQDGIFLSVLGFGMGNIKDNKMEALADKGNGNYAYIDNALEAKKVMVTEFAGTLFTIAKDVKLQVEFNPAKVKAYRLIGYENRVMENSDFNNDKKDAGDMGSGHSVTAFYEVIPADSAENPADIDKPVYQQQQLLPSSDWLQVKIRYKQPAASESILFTKRIADEAMAQNPSTNFSFAAAVCEYAMLIRNSEFKGKASYDEVLRLAKAARGSDPEGYRAEFIRLVELSNLLDDRK